MFTSVYIRRIIYNLLTVFTFGGKVGYLLTGLTTPVGPQSLCYRSFRWRLCVSFGFRIFCLYRGFCHRTGSDLLLFLFVMGLWQIYPFLTFTNEGDKWDLADVREVLNMFYCWCHNDSASLLLYFAYLIYLNLFSQRRLSKVWTYWRRKPQIKTTQKTWRDEDLYLR